ncbi:hypothetical protein IE53DRAFT_229179 [Violaceomyces palustris]|uniref:Uncharacterized protein n=1 Tax=Violaceomyces palustris TaxID=1673888 RepID=A0ACD0NPT9_9BASI|nr:hypothetical protein IE53DRAFT_229179 [Violaceomyces palustris]
MFQSLIRLGSRTTYRGSKGSGAGASTRTTAFSSPKSKNSNVVAVQSGHAFKRAQRGLYDGRIIQSGHNVPKSRHKTARTWEPNVQNKKLWSEVMQVYVRARVTTSAMRTMDKLGGLDFYLANTKDEKLGAWGRDLRERLALKLRKKRLDGESVVVSPQ